MNMQEIVPLTDAQLVEKLDETRRALFALRLNAVTSSVKDYSQFRKLRMSIARMMTALNERLSHTTRSV